MKTLELTRIPQEVREAFAKFKSDISN